MTPSTDLLVQTSQNAIPLGINQLFVAFSGGVDSTALLHSLINQQPKAVHIHHGLSPNADNWANHCKQICANWQIPIEIHRIKINNKNNIEAEARANRYAVFKSLLQPNDVMMTAQHQADQAETFLLQALRGAGISGLAGMPTQKSLGNGLLLRPWLSVSKEEIMCYAHKYKLTWIEDESNSNLRFDRNFLRQTITPLLAKRFPAWDKTLSRSATLCAHNIKQQTTYGDQLPLNALLDQTAQTVVYHWLKSQAGSVPSKAIVEKIITEVAHAKNDASPQISWAKGQVRRYRDHLYFLAKPISLAPLVQTYALKDMLFVPEIDKTLVNLGDKLLQIGFAQGGEVIQPKGCAHHKKLKKIFQEQAIPPWVRRQIPLVFEDGVLIQVIGVCAAKELVECKQ